MSEEIVSGEVLEGDDLVEEKRDEEEWEFEGRGD